jgi:hypothetical protein
MCFVNEDVNNMLKDFMSVWCLICCYVFNAVLVNVSGHIMGWYFEHTSFLFMAEVSVHKTTK